MTQGAKVGTRCASWWITGGRASTSTTASATTSGWSAAGRGPVGEARSSFRLDCSPEQHATHYDRLLKARGFKVIEAPDERPCVYHLYVVEVSNRAAVIEHLKAAGIETGVHYPVPLHLQAAFSHLGYKPGACR